MTHRDNDAGASCALGEGFRWILEVGNPGVTMAMLHDSGAFAPLDAKLAAALSDMVSGPLLRSISTVKEQMALEGKPMKGMY